MQSHLTHQSLQLSHKKIDLDPWTTRVNGSLRENSNRIVTIVFNKLIKNFRSTRCIGYAGNCGCFNPKEYGRLRVVYQRVVGQEECWSNYHEHFITAPRRRNLPFFILNLNLDVVDRVRRLDLQCDCLARQGLDEDCIPSRRRSTRWSVDSCQTL